MADSDKQILITPNVSQTAQPEIKFVGKDNSPLYIKVLDDNSLSFEGTEGQVFSISPTMSSGDIFSVSDISGVQSMAINADGTVKIVSSAITTGIASTENYIYLSPSTTNSFLKTSSNGQQITLAADDDLFLHADDAIIFQSEGTTKMSLHNGKLNIGTATTIDYPLEIESSEGLAIDTDNSGAREKRIYATTSNDGSPWDEMVFFSKGSTGGWSGQHTFLVSKSAGTEYEALRIRDDGGGSTSHVLVSHKLGIGTTSPGAALEIVQDNANNAFGLVVGANVSANSLSDNTRKFTRIGMHHYDTDEEFVNLIVGDSDGTDNKVSLGGGTNQGNAATKVQFYAAADDTTVTGTVQANITSSGLQIGSGARVTTILDQDDMSSNSATSLATQQSIKAYVDANAGGGGVSLSGSTNDQLVTVTGSNAIQGESNLTLSSGGVLALSGNMTIVDSHATTPALVVEQDNSTGSAVIQQWKTQGNELVEVRNNGNIYFHCSTAGGAANESILSYKDTAGTERNMLMLDTGTVCLLNRGPNGDVEIRANSSTAGSGGESVIISATTSGMQLGGANARVTTILDEDNMSTNSATALATQQSIKAYVDANAGGSSSGGTVDKFVALQNTGTGNASPNINVNNTTAQAITWLSEVHKDSIYTHSTSTDPEEITVTEAGTYLITYNINTENNGTNRFVPKAFVYINGTVKNRTMATSYSRGASYDSVMTASWAGIVELSANDVVEVRMGKDDADQTTSVQVQKEGTSISIARISAVGNKASVIAVSSGTTTLTNAQSGSVVYLTSSGAVNLPSSMEKGVQFVIINDTGGNETPGLNGNTHVLGTHGAMSSNTARTYVAVSSGNVAAIG